VKPIAIGSPNVLGVAQAEGGINVAIPSTTADAIALCLFDDADRETDRLKLPGRTGPVFHGFVPDVPAGTRYGLRVWGKWDPARGHRFNGDKLLVDPWATAIDRPFELHENLFDRGTPRPADTAALVPKAVVGTPTPAPGPARPFDWNHQVIYELHVRGFTRTHPDIPPALRGTYAGLAHPAAIAHLTRLGVTTVELMPSAAWLDERHLPPLGLSNYWGYNPMAYLAPDPRLAPGGWDEVRSAVQALQAAGISVVLDVVLNHSGESDEDGPTISLRGLDNAGFYRLRPDNPALYVNDAGCGNILALDRTLPLRLAMDALRAWALFAGLDGFRLDLATTLARRETGFDPAAPLLAAAEQDPLLAGRVMIAEPWDIGPGGYQLGAFPAGWGEWNDRYRDVMRRFWCGDGGMAGAFATRLSGSADIFTGARRPLTRSINFITAHDGFTMADLVAYASKHNEANGEQNRDGTGENHSWNNGVEGPTDNPAVLARRASDIRAMLATLLLSRGTPMLSMGDEAARTQSGNNNAYAQDNATAWFNWAAADEGLIDFTAQLIALRGDLAPLFTGAPLTGQPADEASLPDVAWLRADGRPPSPEDWNRPDNRTIVAVLTAGTTRAALVFHAEREPVRLTLPPARFGTRWQLRLQTTPSEAAPLGSEAIIPARSVTVFVEVEEPHAGRTSTPDDASVEQLANLAGIQPIWWDIDGGRHLVPLDTKRALLRAMRVPADTQDDCRDSLARLNAESTTPLPFTLTVRDGEMITLTPGKPRPSWVTLQQEDGSVLRFRVPADGALSLPPQPLGRHRLLADDNEDHPCHLIVAPHACYLPPELADGARRFGIAAHLYTLRDPHDQGIGDFSTLRRFAFRAAGFGAALLGLNPLHALFPHDRNRASPYHPSDRRFLDPIYIDVSGLPGGAASGAVPGPVDYPTVWAHKRRVLWGAFEASAPDPAPVSEALRRLAIHEAISEDLNSSHWQRWPAELRHPGYAGVAAFAAAHADTVQFNVFLQHLADRQLQEAATSAAADGLVLGFYRDLAVGAAPDGAEAWSNQDALMQGVSVGAPPDPFSVNGQVWSLPPPDPVAQRREGYAGFAALLEANMRHAGALRIDHVMGLQRLFVVPDGARAADGAYVSYPRADLLSQVALHSQRARCLVVGEDLGTVPEGLPEALAAEAVLSYSVLWFERDGGAIKPAATWRQRAAACVSTHDLPTLVGWWEGADIAEKRALGLLDAAQAAAALADRGHEKAQLLELLRTDRLLSGEVDPAAPLQASIAAAVHAFVCSTPALLALVQADDLGGEREAVNLPGTDRERPNWRRRLSLDVDALFGTNLAEAILAAMRPRAGEEG
jgi:glycogen debranching enzyme GlgX